MRRRVRGGDAGPGELPQRLDGALTTAKGDGWARIGPSDGLHEYRTVSPGRAAPTGLCPERPHQEVIFGGWQPGQGRRAYTIGSLLLGLYDDAHSAGAGGLAPMRTIRCQLPFQAGNAVNRERSAGAVVDMRQLPGQHCPEQPSSRLRNNVGHRRMSAVEEELPSC